MDNERPYGPWSTLVPHRKEIISILDEFIENPDMIRCDENFMNDTLEFVRRLAFSFRKYFGTSNNNYKWTNRVSKALAAAKCSCEGIHPEILNYCRNSMLVTATTIRKRFFSHVKRQKGFVPWGTWIWMFMQPVCNPFCVEALGGLAATLVFPAYGLQGCNCCRFAQEKGVCVAVVDGKVETVWTEMYESISKLDVLEFNFFNYYLKTRGKTLRQKTRNKWEE